MKPPKSEGLFSFIAVLIAILTGWIVVSVQGCSATLNAGDQVYQLRIEAPIGERILDLSSPAGWVREIKDTLKQTDTPNPTGDHP